MKEQSQTQVFHKVVLEAGPILTTCWDIWWSAVAEELIPNTRAIGEYSSMVAS